MDDNNDTLVTFNNDQEFNMFGDDGDANHDCSFAEPPPDQSVPAQSDVPVCNDAGSSRTRKRKSQ